MMQENKMSNFSASLLWFGAAISIAEIMTGALLAPLGFGEGLLAIVLGHLIGGILFFFVGLMGAQSGMGAMEGTSITFGRYGSMFFSVLNLLQLLGWTAVMIRTGADAMQGVMGSERSNVWCLLIGGFILLWVFAGLTHVGKLNVFAVGALFVLSVALAVMVFQGKFVAPLGESMQFGLALELSIAMPISWLPLISDYTKRAQRPMKCTLVSTLSYGLGSSLMYLIGLGAALTTGNSDVVGILMSAGLGVAAVLIVLLSTVTTSFLDVYSAGESILYLVRNWNRTLVGALVCLLGTAIALWIPIEQYENFLYLIGTVFVPMATIMITDYFLNRNQKGQAKLNWTNVGVWMVGFALYRVFLGMDTMVGSTIPVVILVMILCIATNRIKKGVSKHV